MSFDAFPLHASLHANIAALGYSEPTPIQAQAIPPILAGRDVLGLAPTGTGKTAAFALPVLNRLHSGGKGRPRVLVIGPTRELVDQICGVFSELGPKNGRRAVAVYGGVGMVPQVRALRSGAELVVACPGRLLDHISHGTVSLNDVEVLVLDEADRMFDMGFLPDIRKIVARLPRNRQTLLFSATMPDDILHLAKEILRDPITVKTGHGGPVSTVSHALYQVSQHLKTNLLLELLRNMETESVLIFTRTKHRARRLGEQLAKAGHQATSLQGNLSQNRRREAMDGFRDGTHRILVATDIAARGIDVSKISHVINFDMPDTVDAYTHRIGRTGRAAKTGDALTLVTGEDAVLIRQIERALGAPIVRRTVPEFDYGAKTAPAGDFSRPPRQHSGPPRRPASASRPASAAHPAPQSSGARSSLVFKSWHGRSPRPAAARRGRA
jgi:ATP-dependent RNA helicase RhlE